MKIVKKPLVTTFTLVVIICMIYFMTSKPEEKSLGHASPLNLQKDAFDDNLSFKTNKVANYNDVDDDDSKDSGTKYRDTEDRIHDNTKESNSELESGSQRGTPKQSDAEIVDANEPELSEGSAFMPKMANETLKAELGNAAWKLFHTILARYPEKPSQQQQVTLKQYIELFAQVYPCGDCARHFQSLLKKSPPQVKSRKNAALWGCSMHNKVNERLGKPIYDCATVLEDYDCGCGDDEKEKDETLGGETSEHLRNINIDEKEDKLQRGG